jgi:hypothetical protein
VLDYFPLKIMTMTMRSSLSILSLVIGLLFVGGVLFLAGNMWYENMQYTAVSPSAGVSESKEILSTESTSTDSLPEESLPGKGFFPEIISAFLPSQEKKSGEEVHPSKQATEPDAVIFAARIGSGWQNNSWGIRYDEQTSSAVSGNYILATYGKPWEGLSFYSKGFLVSQYNELAFTVNFRDATSSDVYVSLYNGKQKLKSVALKNYVDAFPLSPNTWQEVRIPLTDFSLVEPLVTQVSFESEKADTIAFAHIRFALNNEIRTSKSSGVVAAPKESTLISVQAVAPAKTTVQDNPFLSGWTMDTWGSDIRAVPGETGVLRVQFFKPWGTLIFQNGKHIDISTADTIIFSISDDTDSNAKLYVIAYNVQGEKMGTVLLNDFIPSKKISVHAYQEVLLPLFKLNPAGQPVGRIDIQAEGTTGVILLKNVALVRLTESSHGTVPVSQIYRGGFRNTWKYDLAGVIVHPASTKRSFLGDHSVQLNFTSPWSSFSIVHPSGFATHGYRSLSFMVYGGETGGQELYLTAFDKEGKKLGTKYLTANTPSSRILARTWSSVSVPLAEVNAEGSLLGRIEIESAAPTEDIWLDDVKFLED